jgi:polyphosphate glucokinase
MQVMGIDIGGTGIKGAPVDIETGVLLAPRLRIRTPIPSKPLPVAEVIAQIINQFEWRGPVGCGFPSPIRDNVVMTAANVSKKWIGVNAAEVISEATGCPVRVINDADAAGLAEITFGAGRGRKGAIIIVTIGTGLGTALFIDGKLFPNTELGHLEVDGLDAETRASDAARRRERLSWERWGKRIDRYLHELERLFWPDLFILGGGLSNQFEKYASLLTLQTEVITAQLLNKAGIVGAALAARSLLDEAAT